MESNQEEGKTGQEEGKTGFIAVNDLVPVLGCCCCICSCYLECPDMLGAVCNNTLCCCQWTALLCKCGKEEGICCKCCSMDVDVISLQVCCKIQTQLCCLDCRSALPTIDEIPCLLSLLCLTCCYRCKPVCACGSDIAEIDHKTFARIRQIEAEEEEEYREKEKEKKRRAKRKARGAWRQVTDPKTNRM